MSTRTTLILALLTIVLLVYVQFFSNKAPGTLELESRQRHLMEIVQADVNRIEITTPDGALVFSRIPPHDWQIESPCKYPANGEALGSLLADLEYRERVGTLNRKELGNYDKAMEQFGLAQPHIQLKVRQNAENYSLDLGRETVRKGVVYGRITHNKKEEIVLLEQGIEPYLQKPLDQWRSSKVFDFVTGDVASITLRQDSREVDLQRDDSNWVIIKPLSTRASTEEVNTFMAMLLGVHAQKFVSDNAADFAVYGINTPWLVLDVKDKTGSPIGTLRVGRVESGGNAAFYGQISDRPTIFQLEKNTVDQISGMLEKVRDRHIVRLRSSTEVSSIRFEKDKFSIELQRKDGSQAVWEIAGPEKLPADARVIDDFLSKLQNARATDFLSVADSKIDTAAKPLARMVLTLKLLGVKEELKPYELLFTAGKKADLLVQSQFRDDVAVVPADVLVGLPDQKADWISRKLALFDEKVPITKISWKSAAGTFQVARGLDQNWPDTVGGKKIYGKLLQKQAATLADLTVLSWVQATEKDFASPNLTLTVETASQKQVLDLVWDAKNNRALGRVQGSPYAFWLGADLYQSLNLWPLNDNENAPAPAGK